MALSIAFEGMMDCWSDDECDTSTEKAVANMWEDRFVFRMKGVRFADDVCARICSKSNLARLRLHCTPEAFVLAQRSGGGGGGEGEGAVPDAGEAAFLAAFAASKAAGENQIWIAKSATGFGGAGIEVFDDEATARSVAGAPRADEDFVVQRYLMDPMLLGGVKFDMRLMVVVMAGGGKPTSALLHRRSGYGRFCTGAWSAAPDRLQDSLMHVSNCNLFMDDPDVS